MASYALKTPPRVAHAKPIEFLIEKLGPGTSTKHKTKGEALAQSISLDLVYTPTLHKLLDHFQGP